MGRASWNGGERADHEVEKAEWCVREAEDKEKADWTSFRQVSRILDQWSQLSVKLAAYAVYLTHR